MTSHGIDVLTENECYEYLRGRTLGRMGFVRGNDVLVLPVYYAVLDRDIVFRTSPGAKLDEAVLGDRVTFEVDDSPPGWSVEVRGHAHEIRDEKTAARAEAALGTAWPAGERNRLVRITAENVTGRALRSG